MSEIRICSLKPSEQFFSYIMWRTSYIWWDDDDVCFVLDQHTELDFNSANSLKQQSVDRDVVWLLTCNLDSELLFFKWCGEEANTNVIVFVLIRLGIYLTLAKHANHYIMMPILCDTIWFLVLNTIFSNISTISWQSVLVVEEAGVPTESPRPWASNW